MRLLRLRHLATPPVPQGDVASVTTTMGPRSNEVWTIDELRHRGPGGHPDPHVQLFTISCETDGGGAIVTVANDIISVLTAAAQSPSPWAITAALAEGSNGSGLVNATDPLPLTGGTSNATGVTYRVRGSV
jgi:hypothetical protein